VEATETAQTGTFSASVHSELLNLVFIPAYSLSCCRCRCRVDSPTNSGPKRGGTAASRVGPEDALSESSSRGAEALCRTYIDTPLEETADLVASHPCSSHFLSFFIYKFLFYVLCLLVVTMQIFVTYPSLYAVATLKLSVLDKYSALMVEKVLFVILSGALVVCRLTWIVGIYKVT
jgi:hypothetical protein